MRHAVLVVALLAGCATPEPRSAPGPVVGADVWQGMLRCDVIPGLTTLMLNQPIVVTVAAGRAQYERDVRRADTNQASGIAERGGGAVAADGAVVLTGSAQSRNYVYTARYEGRLPPGGGTALLTGAQQWEAGPATGSFRRGCTMQLSR